MTAMVALFQFTARQTLRDVKFWLAVAALFLPCVLVGIIRYFGEPPRVDQAWELYHGVVCFMVLLGLVPLICMIYGTGLIGSEVESRTITYLITRTLKRRTVLFVRFAAVFALLTLACCASVVGLHVSIVAGQAWAVSLFSNIEQWAMGRDLAIYLAMMPLAVGGFLSLFTLIGIIVTRPLAWSLVYFVMFELVAGNVPAEISRYSLARQVRSWVVNVNPAIADLNPNILVGDPNGIWNVLAVIVVALVLSGIWIGRRELVPHKVARD